MREKFVGGLSTRMSEIRSTEGSQGRFALHRLVGAAGMFGYEALGAAAKRAEVAMRQDEPSELASSLDALETIVKALSTRQHGGT
jgi:HPt (histidine-containing phosphotransfer) domain-containing protein